MKRTLNYFLAAAIIMALGSCAKETEKINPSEKELIKASVRANTAELNSETRTSLAENGDLYWSYEDEISVFDGTGNREFTADISATDDPTKTASFEGVIDPDATSFVALYPYDEDATYASGVVTTTLPAVQEAVVGSFANNSNVAVATGDSSNMDGDEDYALCQFSFKNIGALVKFTISQANTHKSVSVKVKNADGSFDNIAGAVEIVPATAIATVAATGGVDAVTVSAASGKLAAGDYYAIILPVTGEGKKISFVFSDGNATKTRTTKTAVTIARSSYLDMGTIDEGITYPDNISGSYLILAKKADDDNFYVMSSNRVSNKAWTAVDTEVSVGTPIDVTNSSVNFATYSTSTYKWIVSKMDGGYSVYNEVAKAYLAPGTSSGNGTESDDPVALFVNRDGETGAATISGNNLDLQFNASSPRFTFYTQGGQKQLILVKYTGAATPCSLSIACELNVVTITASPANADVYYTIDGSDPTTSSIHYTEPFEITETVTIKAKAFAPSSDYTDSEVFTEECTFEDVSSYWNLVTSASDLSAGDMVVIASFSKGKVAGSTISNSRLVPATGTTTFTESGNAITNLSSDAAVFTLGGETGSWSLTNSEGVLGATTAGKLAYDSGERTWSISVTENGDATILNGNSSYGRFLFNVNSNWFTTYTSDPNVSMLLPQLYRKPDSRTMVTLSFSPANPNDISLGETFTEPTLTKTPADAPITYSVSTNPSGIATINSSTGKLNIIGAGSITVTATVSNTETYRPASASYSFNVTPAVATIATILADNTITADNEVAYKTNGVTVIAKQGVRHIIKDASGSIMLMYYNGTPALEENHVYNLDGKVTLYNGVHEYNNPTATEGTATPQTTGTPVEMSVSEVTAYASAPVTKYVKLHFTASASGQAASDGTNNFYVYDATESWSNMAGRAVEATGYLIGKQNGSLNVLGTAFSIDETVPYLTTSPVDGSTLNWEYNEYGSTNGKTVTVEVNENASFTVNEDEEEDWTITKNSDGTVTVYPNAQNGADTDKTFTLVITHDDDEDVVSEITLKQLHATQGGVPANTVLFSENWGTSASSIASYNGSGASSYNDASTITYATTNTYAKIDATSNITNCTAAHLYINGKDHGTNYTVTISGIKTYGAKKVRVIFACNNTNTTVGIVESSSAAKKSANSAENTADFVLTGNEETITLKIYNNAKANTRSDDYQVIFIE